MLYYQGDPQFIGLELYIFKPKVVAKKLEI